MASATPHTKVGNVVYFTLASAIGEFRRHVEQEAGVKLTAIDLNAGLFLLDLCEYLKMNEREVLNALGHENYTDTVLHSTERAWQTKE